MITCEVCKVGPPLKMDVEAVEAEVKT